MAKVIGKIETLVGEVKILGADGTLRDATVGGAIYAGEQIVSTDPGAQFEVKYLALEETSIYEGIFRVLADGSVIAGVDAMESIINDEALKGLLETAAGQDEENGNSAYIPDDVVAESSVQGFSQGGDNLLGGSDGSDAQDEENSIDTNDFEPTAEDGTNVATEDDRTDVTGQLVGADLDGDAFEFVLVDGLGEDEGTLTLNPDGSYVYNVDYDFQDLRIGETRDVTFTYKTVETTTPEGYESEIATVTITVTGTNDRPIVENINVNGYNDRYDDSYDGYIYQGEDQTIYETHDNTDYIGEDDTQGEDGNNIFTGTLSVFDLDTNDVNDINDTHIFEVVGEVSIVNPDNVDITAGPEKDSEGNDTEFDVKVSITFNEETQEWEYKIDGDFSELAAGETSTLTFDYVAIDNSDDNIAGDSGNVSAPNESDTSDAKTITLTITGTNDQPVVNNITLDAIDESFDNTPIIAGTDAYANGEDDTQDDVLTTFNGSLATAEGTLPDETTTTNIQDDDTNDTHTYHLSGDVIVVDQTSQDTAEDNTIQDLGITASVVLDEITGEYTISGNFNALAYGESATVTFSYYVEDSSVNQISGESNESEIKTVTLTVNGTNDQPIVEDVDANSSGSYATGEVLSVDHDITSSGDNSIGYSHFTVYETTTITITTDGPTIDPELFLLRDDGDLSSDDYITDNDDGWTPAGSWSNSIITITLEAGNYIAAVSDYNLSLQEVIDGINSNSMTGTVTLNFTANHPIDLYDTNVENTVVYESHDNDNYANGEDDTSFTDRDANGDQLADNDEFTTFDGNLATVSDDDTNDTHTYQVVAGSLSEDSTIVTDLTVTITDPVTGDYTITGNFNALAAGETATVTFNYVAVDNSGEDNESAMSEPKTVTLVITGTNDQPVADTVTLGDTENDQAPIYETHDNDAYQDGEDNTSSETDIGEDRTTTLSGTLSTSDDDASDTHMFNVQTLSGRSSNNITYTHVYYDEDNDTNTGDSYYGDADIQVKVESSDIDPTDIDLESLTLLNNDGGDRSAGFQLVGNFNALAAEETATITFMYTADDQEGFGGEDTNNESSISEPKLVTITVTGTNDQPIITNIDTRDALETELTSMTYGADIDVSLTDVEVDPFTAEGSALKVVLDTAAGETVTFDWAFDLRDWNYMQDAAFVVVDGVVTTLADGSIDANGTFEFIFATAGEHTIVIGVLNNHDNQDYQGSSLLAITNTNGGELISSEIFGAVSENANGYDMSANSDLSVTGLDAFIDLQEVTYENAHLSGNLDTENRVDVSDDDNNDDYTYVAFSDRIVDFTESHDDAGDIDLITTPIRVSLDEDGNYDVISSSFDKLGEGDSVTITFDIQVRDTSGTPDGGVDGIDEDAVSEPKTVTIVINGTNDAPVLESVTASDALESDLTNIPSENSILTGQLSESVTDEDVNDSYAFVPSVLIAAVVDTNGVINGLTTVSIKADGEYKIYNSSFNNLGTGESITVSFDVQIQDDSGVGVGDADNETSFSNIQRVTLTISGTNDQPVVENMIFGATEVMGSANTTVNGFFIGEDEDTNDTLTYGVVSMDANTDVEDIAGDDYVRVEDVPYDADGDGVYESYVDIAVKLDSLSEVDLDDVDFTGIKVTGSSFELEGDFNTLPVDEVMSVKFLYNATDDSGAIVNASDESAVSDNGMVTLTVTGTNDEAEIITPVGQDAGEVAEDTILAVDGQLHIIDLDAGEAEFIPDTQTDTYGTFTIDASGAWQYELDNVAAQAIGNEIVTETFTVSSEDTADSQVVTITIHGQNDEVIITSAVDTGAVEEDVTVEAIGTVEFSDIDFTDVHTVSSDRTLKDTDYSTTMGTFEAVKTADTTGTGIGGVAAWTYTLSAAASQELAAGQSVTETYTISIDDGSGSVATQDVVITITGTNDAPEIQVVDVDGSITEGSVLSDSGSITFTDVDLTDRPEATITDVSITGEDGDGILELSFTQLEDIESAFTIDETITNANNGEVTWNYEITEGKLDFLGEGDEVTAVFSITVDDGKGGVVSENITVIIHGTNDAPTVTAETTSVLEDATVTGTIAFDDVDGDATVTVDGVVPTGLTLHNLTGDYTFDANSYDYLAEGEELEIVVPLIVSDGITDVSTTLTITITGTNDAPSVTSEVLSGAVTEDNLPLTATGAIVLEDADLLDAYDVNVAANTNLGNLTAIVATVGEARTVTWDYAVDNADVQYLTAGEVKTETFTLTITSDNGDVVIKDVEVTITGTNDVAVITNDFASDIAQDVYEDGLSFVDGQLNISDLDAGEAEFTPDTQSSTYGSFEVAVSGRWQYTLDNAAAQVLGEGETVEETFIVLSKDGETSQVVTISINGSDDAPTVEHTVVVAREVVVDFDDLVADPAYNTYVVDAIPNGYRGISWDNHVSVMELDAATDFGGYDNGIVSGDNVAFNGSGISPTVMLFDEPATFNSTFLTSAWATTQDIVFEGYLDGVLVYTSDTIEINNNTPTLIELNWSDIDKLSITNTVTGPYEGAGSGSHWAMDDFTYTIDDVVLSINDVDGGSVNLGDLALTTIDKVELSGETDINISVADVIDITDGDNELVITSDGGNDDNITLDGFGSGVYNGDGTYTYTGSVGGEVAIIIIEDTIAVD